MISVYLLLDCHYKMKLRLASEGILGGVKCIAVVQTKHCGGSGKTLRWFKQNIAMKK